MRFKKHLNEGIFDKIFGKGKDKEEKSTVSDYLIQNVLEGTYIHPESDIKAIKDIKFYTMELEGGKKPVHEYLAKKDIVGSQKEPGFKQLMDALLENPNFSNALDGYKDTPLHILAAKVPLNSSLAYKVLYHKAATNLNSWHVSPLHILAHRGWKYILSVKESAIVKDDEGNTPAHYLALYMRQHKQITKEDIEDFKNKLLGKMPTNNKDYTPIDILEYDWALKSVSHISYKQMIPYYVEFAPEFP